MARGPAKPRKDRKPDPHTFANVTSAALNTDYTSLDGWTLEGINVPVSVSVTGGTMSKNGGLFSTTAFTAQYGDTIRARVRSSGAGGEARSVTVTAGETTASFTVTTVGAPVTPTLSPAFTPVTDADVLTEYESPNETVIGGIAAGVIVDIGVSGGSYSLNGGAYTVVAGQGVLGDRLRVKRFSAATYATPTNVTVNAGTASQTFTITTEDQPIPPPPTTDQQFGEKTRNGFGAILKGLTAGSAVTGVDAADFSPLNASGNLVPSGTRGGAHTYLKAPGSTYSLTFMNASTQDIGLLADAAHIIANPTDTATSNELLSTLGVGQGSAGALELGDSVIGRDSFFNPTGVLWRFSRPTAGWAGTGVITIKSENPEEGTDANGNPLRGGGFNVGSLTSNQGTDFLMPVTFEDVSFYSESVATGRPKFVGYSNATVGYGVSATRCRFENAPSVPQGSLNYGMTVRGGTAHQCHFQRLVTCMDGGVLGHPTTITECIGQEIVADGMTLKGNFLTVEDNFFFNFPFLSAAHPDVLQHLGTQDADLTDLGSIRRNIGVRNVSAINTGVTPPQPRDAQGIFLADTVSPYWVYGAEVENNIMCLTAQMGLALARYRGAQVRFNTIITAIDPMGTGVEAQLAMTIYLNNCENCDVSNNVAMAVSFNGGSGNTNSKNVTLAKTLAAVQLAFPNYRGGANPGQTTRAEVLRQFTPANRLQSAGGVMQSDGTCSGALFPAVTGQQIGAWNDGSVFSPNNPTWVAAHPPAA